MQNTIVSQPDETKHVPTGQIGKAAKEVFSKLCESAANDLFEPCFPTPRERLPGHAGIIYQLYKNPIELLTDEHYENAVVVNELLGMRAVFLRDPRHIRQVFVTDRETYGLDPIRKLLLRQNFKRGLAAIEGAEWDEARKLAAAEFTRERLQRYAAQIARIANTFCQRQPDERSGSLSTMVNEIALASSMTCLFSTEDAGLYDTISETNAIYLERGMSIDLMDILRMPSTLPRLLKRSVMSIARQHRKMVGDLYWSRKRRIESGEPAPDDLLTAICRHYARKSHGGNGHSDALDNVGTMLGAAYDTTSKAISWTIYLLANSPETLEAVRTEIAEGRLAGQPPHRWAESLPLLVASVRETLRLYPPIPGTVRYARRKAQIDNQRIRKGDFIVANIWAMQRSSRFWENATRFQPHRFLEKGQDKRSEQHFMPFGIGPRTCVGRHFAELECVIVLAMLLENFDFTYIGKGPPRPVWKGTLRSSNGIPATMKRRT